jgi:hypothetical protein
LLEVIVKGALDFKRRARGRGYAERGHVDAITVTPGLVLAYVQGSRRRPYRVQVRLRAFDEDEWERLLETAGDLTRGSPSGGRAARRDWPRWKNLGSARRLLRPGPAAAPRRRPARAPALAQPAHPPGSHVQLCFGCDGLWYAYKPEPGDDWWPRGTLDLDSVGALTRLGAADE